MGRRQCASKGAVWLRQEQMAELFGRERTVIGRYIRNVFADGEPVREQCAKSAYCKFGQAGQPGCDDHRWLPDQINGRRALSPMDHTESV